MRRFNLSEWAITHRALVLFMILLIGAAGLYSYSRLGRAEDPSFTIKVMNVQVGWPGATAAELQTQVVDKIEKKLQELPFLDRVIELFAARRRLHPGHALRHHAAAARQGALVSGAQEGRRHPRRPARGRHRPEFQRRVRRRLFGALHDHRRRHEPRPSSRRWPRTSASACCACRASTRSISSACSRSGSSSSSATPSSRRSASRRSRSSTASRGRTRSSPAARSKPPPTASTCASPAPSPAPTRSPPCRCRRTAACSVSATSRRSSAATRTRRNFLLREGGKPALGLGVSMEDGANILTLGENLKQAMKAITAELPVGHRDHAGRRPAAHRRRLGVGIPQDLRRGARHRAAGELPHARLAHRHRGRAVGAAGAGDRVHRDVRDRARPAPHHARRAHHRARAPGRRRHHRDRDDGGEDGAGLRPRPRRHLRLDLDRVPDADRHAGDGRGLPAGRLRQFEHRRICRRHLLGRRPGAGRVLVRGGAVHALSRREAAARLRQARRRAPASRSRTRSTTPASIARCGA